MRFILAIVLFFASTLAFGYSSGVSDPKNSSYPIEYRSVVKTASGSDASGLSSSISKGHILTLDTANNPTGASSVTRIGENSVLGVHKTVCVAADAIATGDVGSHKCVTRGYVDYLRYDASTAISIGMKLCANAEGVAVACAACTEGGDPDTNTNCRFGNATDSSGIISLESKSSGTGSNLKAFIRID